MSNLISVIIPVYNAERYLERCLKSVMVQTHQQLEIIVVNDGSTDDSSIIINRFAEKDSRIIAIHQKNAGVSAARNAGLERATGNFIGFVDGDDEIFPDMYEFLLYNLNTYTADISHCGFEWVKQNTVVKFHDTGIILEQDHHEGLIELLEGKRFEPSTCTKLYRKSVVKDVRFPEGIRWNEDLFFNVLAFNNAKKSIFVDVVKYRYMQNLASASQVAFTEKMAEDIYRVSFAIKKELTDPGLKKNVDVFFVGKMLSLLQAAKNEGIKDSEVIKKIKMEISKMNTSDMGFRIQLLKFLLIKFPFLYDSFYFLYTILFAKNQKWNE